MVARVRRRRGSALGAGLLVLFVTIVGDLASGQEPQASASTTRLRAIDAKSAALLAAGKAHSPTFRALAERVEQSDLVVHVCTRRLSLPAQLEFVSATPGARYLRVSVRVQGLEIELLPLLAHELRHAMEIASAPEVRDAASLVRFYSRIGSASRGAGAVQMETIEAQAVQETVLRELRRGKRRE